MVVVRTWSGACVVSPWARRGRRPGRSPSPPGPRRRAPRCRCAGPAGTSMPPVVVGGSDASVEDRGRRTGGDRRGRTANVPATAPRNKAFVCSIARTAPGATQTAPGRPGAGRAHLVAGVDPLLTAIAISSSMVRSLVSRMDVRRGDPQTWAEDRGTASEVARSTTNVPAARLRRPSPPGMPAPVAETTSVAFPVVGPAVVSAEPVADVRETVNRNPPALDGVAVLRHHAERHLVLAVHHHRRVQDGRHRRALEIDAGGADLPIGSVTVMALPAAPPISAGASENVGSRPPAEWSNRRRGRTRRAGRARTRCRGRRARRARRASRTDRDRRRRMTGPSGRRRQEPPSGG